MKKTLFGIGCRTPGLRLLAPRFPVVLLYHGISSSGLNGELSGQAFEQHVIFLQRHFEIVTPDRVHERKSRLSRPRVVLTFDDGFRNNAEVVAPILRRHNVAAIFFVSSHHAGQGMYLWFAYLKALSRHWPEITLTWRNEKFDMTPLHRPTSIQQLRSRLLALRPHPEAMYEALSMELPPVTAFVDSRVSVDLYEGMTEDHVRDMAQDDLFRFGGHTVTHPFLSWCEPGRQRMEIDENRHWLERLTEKSVPAFSYPIGDYDRTTLDICRDCGYRSAFAVRPSLRQDPEMEIERIGVYRPSTASLGFKICHGSRLRRLGFNLG